MPVRRLQAAIGASSLLFFLLLLTLSHPTPRALFSDRIQEWRSQSEKKDLEALPVLDEYTFETPQTSFCLDRYSTKYFDNLRNRSTQYCSAGSVSNLTCFHSHLSLGPEIDSLCLASGVVYNFAEAKFSLNCPARNLSSNETSNGDVPFESIRSYWYETGPKYILDRFVDLEASEETIRFAGESSRPGGAWKTPGKEDAAGPSFTLLIKREGETNPWHSLMEIMSMSWTFDVLQMARDPRSGLPLFNAARDIENTQVIILDDRVDGPYFDLWRLFSGRTPKRLAELSPGSGDSWLSAPLDNVIIPLAGASNPLWQNDWVVRDCVQCQLLRTFVRRVLAWYHVLDRPAPTANIRLTFIDRKAGRQLIGQDKLLDAVRSRFPEVEVQAVDLAALPFDEQLRVARETDLLVGVHGAGLTHLMFMNEGHGAVVEIQPEELHHKGFRNLALMLSQEYFLAHAAMVDQQSAEEVQAPSEPNENRAERNMPRALRREAELQKRDRWHTADVTIDEEKFTNLMEMAIKSLYNKGPRNDDVV